VERARGKLQQIHEQVGENIKISFDEWNVWYAWYRPSCVIDGIYSALMMQMVIEEAQRSGIVLACQFEAVNESAIKVPGDGGYLTATGQALAFVSGHANGILRYASDGVVVTEKEGVFTMTAVNSSYDTPYQITFKSEKEIKLAKLYEGRSLLPHSYFKIVDADIKKTEEEFQLEIPPHSMVLIQY
jgi:hypothetical protein